MGIGVPRSEALLTPNEREVNRDFRKIAKECEDTVYFLDQYNPTAVPEGWIKGATATFNKPRKLTDLKATPVETLGQTKFGRLIFMTLNRLPEPLRKSYGVADHIKVVALPYAEDPEKTLTLQTYIDPDFVKNLVGELESILPDVSPDDELEDIVTPVDETVTSSEERPSFMKKQLSKILAALDEFSDRWGEEERRALPAWTTLGLSQEDVKKAQAKLRDEEGE